MQYYKLVDKVPVKLTDLTEIDHKSRTIGKTTLPSGKLVSTVFLCFDHYWGDDDEHDPILFESMLFPGNGDFTEEDMDRYTSYEDALQGHWNMVEKHGGLRPDHDHFEDDLFEL